jgi:hypothetical protein
MTPRLQSILRLFALAAAFGVISTSACWAQLGGPGLSGNGIGPVTNPAGEQQQTKSAAPARPLPPALPGAKSDPSLVAPATKLPTDMNPTDALFDAINRGDIAAARDAINRGADLDGQNVLGMTPMELSIDLSRNDISFLLLSMRGGDSGSRQPPPQQTAKGKGQKPAHDIFAATKAAPVPKVTAPPPPRVARLFSGDGGTPVPQAGFLGFDSSGRN